MVLTPETAPLGTPVIFQPAFKHPYSNHHGVINKQLDYTHPMELEILLTSGKHVNVDYCELVLDTEAIEHDAMIGTVEVAFNDEVLSKDEQEEILTELMEVGIAFELVEPPEKEETNGK